MKKEISKNIKKKHRSESDSSDEEHQSSNNFSFGRYKNTSKQISHKDHKDHKPEPIDKSMFENKDMTAKTMAVQDEFNNLLLQMQNKEHHGDGDFSMVVNEQYLGQHFEENEKHSSPTKRLISHKNTTFKHKKVLKDNV